MGTLQNFVFLWRRGVLTLFLLGFAISMVSAQQKTVTGKVTSATEGPLPGVNIVVQGTTTGVMTDIQGNFSIVVPGPQAVLTFTFIGYAPQSITVGTQTSINVELVPAMSALNEVVVTGYGTQKKREVTSSITSVKSDEFDGVIFIHVLGLVCYSRKTVPARAAPFSALGQFLTAYNTNFCHYNSLLLYLKSRFNRRT